MRVVQEDKGLLGLENVHVEVKVSKPRFCSSRTKGLSKYEGPHSERQSDM